MPNDNDPTQSTEETTQTQDQTPESTPSATPPTQTAPTEPAAPASPPPAASTPSTKKVISMPSDGVAKIRREERTKGRQLRDQELAKELGFASIEEMKEAAKRGKSVRRTEPAAKPSTSAKPAKDAKRLQEQEEERQRLLRKNAVAQRAARIAQKQRDAALVEGELRVAAVRAGVIDIDYALHLLRQRMKGKDAKELEKFDESAFFTGLRESHPHLFVVETRPVTTGNGSTAKPGDAAPKPPPKPGDAVQKAAGDQVVDARKMTREDYEKRLADMGIPNPAQGFSY